MLERCSNIGFDAIPNVSRCRIAGNHEGSRHVEPELRGQDDELIGLLTALHEL